MNRTKLDVVVGIFVAGVLVLGAGAAWQTYRQARVHSEMMGDVGAIHGPHPAWYLLGAGLVAVVVGGAYWAVRDELGTAAGGRNGAASRGVEPESAREPESGSDSGPESGSGPANDSGPEGNTASESGPVDDGASTEDAPPRPTPQLLSVLPADERRIIEPVIESPGVTQIELRDRADFSKSKVSQTVTDLEKRGLLYRERQGRTYRIYPSDDLLDRLE